MKASTVTAVTVIGGIIAAVVGLLTIPTLLGAKNAAASTGGGAFGGGPAAPEPSGGGGSSALGGFFDWLGHLGQPAGTVPAVGGSGPANGNSPGYPSQPGAVGGPGTGGASPTQTIFLGDPSTTSPRPVIPAPPRSSAPRMNPRVLPTPVRTYGN